MRPSLLTLIAALCITGGVRAADVSRTYQLAPGSPAERLLGYAGAGDTVDGPARKAEPGGSWSYRVPMPPGARCTLQYRVLGPAGVAVTTPKGKPVLVAVERAGDLRTITFSAPPKSPGWEPLTVTFRAAGAACSVTEIALAIKVPDANGDGIPDCVDSLMGIAPGEFATATPARTAMRLLLRAAPGADPLAAPANDGVLLAPESAPETAAWQAAGFNVIPVMAAGLPAVQPAPGPTQQAPPQAGEQPPAPVQPMIQPPAMVAMQAAEPPAGYEGTDPFKQAWQTLYGVAWQEPSGSVTTRMQAATLTATMVSQAVSAAGAAAPAGAERMVMLPSPLLAHDRMLGYGPRSIVAGVTGAWFAPTPDSGAQLGPLRSAGARATHPFEASSLANASFLAITPRGRSWLGAEPSIPSADTSYAGALAQSVAACLVQPGCDRVILPTRPTNAPAEVGDMAWATVAGSLSSESGSAPSLDTGTQGISIAISDVMPALRCPPANGNPDAFGSLAAPLLAHGIPVQAASLDRLPDPSVLAGTRLLVLSEEVAPAPRPEAHRAIADWVKKGGALMLVGGDGALAGLPGAWWTAAKVASPVDDLLAQLGLAAARTATPGSPLPPGTQVAKFDPGQGPQARPVTIDLTPHVQAGSIVVGFRQADPAAAPCGLQLMELRINGRLAAAFRAGSEIETRFLVSDLGSMVEGDWRQAGGAASWAYRFDRLPAGSVTLTAVMRGGWSVTACDPGGNGTLLRAASDGIPPALAGVRIRDGHTLTPSALPAGARALYMTPDGKAAAWEAKVGTGSVLYLGISPAFLSATAQATRLYRMLLKRLCDNSQVDYSEQSYFTARRGSLVAVETLGRKHSLSGRYVDLMDPQLRIAEDPTVGEHSGGLFMSVRRADGTPRVAAAAGRVIARVEQRTQTALWIETPVSRPAVIRYWAPGKSPVGVKATTWLGSRLPASMVQEGSTLRVTVDGSLGGVVVRVGWK